MAIRWCGAALAPAFAVFSPGAALSAPPSPEHAYRYEVEAGPGARELRVEAWFARGGDLVVDRSFAPYLRDVEVEAGGGFRLLEGSGASWPATACEASGCHVRYRFLLAEAAREVRDIRRAYETHGTLLAPPSTWLLRPGGEAGGRFRLHVATPPDVSFVTGLFPSSDGATDTYEASADALSGAPYSGFGAFDVARVQAPGAEIVTAMPPDGLPAPRAAVVRWVETSARAVAAYFGRFPVPHGLVLLVAGNRGGVGYGTTLGNGGASIMVFVGPQAKEADLPKDWVLAHEMVHLGCPDLVGAPTWLEEGLATYVEPIARGRIGNMTEEEVWRELIEGLPRGLSGSGDGGLDSARGFQRIYWGGALYWLLADIEIREKTRGRRGLDDALRSIVAVGGNGSVSWPMDRALEEAEQAVGVPALRERREQMGSHPVNVDLPALWKRLGVALQDGRVVFDERAPLAAIRRAITAR